MTQKQKRALAEANLNAERIKVGERYFVTLALNAGAWVTVLEKELVLEHFPYAKATVMVDSIVDNEHRHVELYSLSYAPGAVVQLNAGNLKAAGK